MLKICKTSTVKLIYAAVAGNMGMFLASALFGVQINWYFNALFATVIIVGWGIWEFLMMRGK
jgi:hypothetical protein